MSKREELEIEVEIGEDEEIEQAAVGILSAESAEELANYLHEEIEACETERLGRVAKWAKWRRQREARPEFAKQSYPFKGAANVSVPVAAMLTQNMYAYIKATFKVRDPLMSINAYNTSDTDLIEQAVVIEKYLDLLAESPFDLHLRAKYREIAYEGTSMGTVFVKVPWITDKWVFRTTDDEGNIREVESFLHDGPDWIPISLDDAFYRENVSDIQRAPWFSHRVVLSEPELKNRDAAGVYDSENIKEVLLNYRTEALENETADNTRRGVEQQDIKVYDLFETYVFWNMPDTNYMIDLLVTYHRDSNKIIRAEYNTLGIRTVAPASYLLRPGSLDGIGVGWLSEHMQDEVDTHHRMRINNAHFAGMRMLAVKRGAGLKGQEKIYP